MKNKNTCNTNNYKRTRYFHGQLLTDRDFKEEQIYHNEKRKLLNRMLHGWGVVCGLKVKPTTPASKCVIVEPGVALDCHGNEIVVCEEQTIDLSAKLCQSTGAQEDPCASYTETSTEDTTLYVVIKYHESHTDPLPVYAPGGSCEEKTCDYSRIQEGFCIEVRDSLPPQPPIQTLESGEACTEPFPCPPDHCCPDLHYILLATISCGPRKDGIFGRRIKDENGAEIRYSIERTLHKVCICQGSSATNSDTITVTDNYEFETIGDIGIEEDNAIWKLDWSSLQNQNLEVEDSIPLNPVGQKPSVIYQIKATVTDEAEACLKVPVTLECDGKTWDLQPTCEKFLKSPIQIGTTDVRHSSTISKALIRNVEHRKFVPTFRWFAWLSEVLEELGQELPWSGEASPYCAASEEETCGVTKRRLTIIDKLNRRITKIKEELHKEMEEKLAKAIKEKEAEIIKKVENSYQKNLTAMDKRIKELEKSKK